MAHFAVFGAKLHHFCQKWQFLGGGVNFAKNGSFGGNFCQKCYKGLNFVSFRPKDIIFGEKWQFVEKNERFWAILPKKPFNGQFCAHFLEKNANLITS